MNSRCFRATENCFRCHLNSSKQHGNQGGRMRLCGRKKQKFSHHGRCLQLIWSQRKRKAQRPKRTHTKYNFSNEHFCFFFFIFFHNSVCFRSSVWCSFVILHHLIFSKLRNINMNRRTTILCKRLLLRVVSHKCANVCISSGELSL